MRRKVGLLGVLFLMILAGAGQVAAAGYEILHAASYHKVNCQADLPPDLLQPEGKDRWYLTALPADGSFNRLVTSNETKGEDAHRWLLPQDDIDLADPKAKNLYLSAGALSDELWVQVRRVGVGWIHLPAPQEPREVVLQLALIYRKPAGATEYIFERQLYRWIDPRAGVVAEIWGNRISKGFLKNEVQGASYLNEVQSGLTPLKIYHDQIDLPTNIRLAYGFDHQARSKSSGNLCGVRNASCGSNDQEIRISDLTTPSYSTIGDLVYNASSSWDFSVNNVANASWQWASVATAVADVETCNYSNFFNSASSWQCGVNPAAPGLTILREDRGFDEVGQWVCNGTTTPCRTGGDCAGIGDGFCFHHSDISLTQGQNRGTDYTIWSRGGVVKEGEPGSLGAGESFYCHGRQANDSNGRPQIALYRFPNPEGGRFYMAVGDPVWGTAETGDEVFNCDQDFNSHRCPTQNCGFGCQSWANGCNLLGSVYSGTQSGQVVKEGPITLPSGHTFQSLVVKTKAEICTGGFSGCLLQTTGVRTVIYLWVTPYLGTLVRLQSVTNAADETSFSVLDESDIKYGLFPPLSMTVTGATSHSVTLSWNPGLPAGGPNRLVGYNIYWGTQSGVYGAPQFVDGGTTTSATIDGLMPGTTYFFTVTSLSDYRDPASQQTHRYESLKYPSTVPTNGTALPLEVSTATTCTPTKEVEGLTVTKENGGTLKMCWTQPADSCVTGYRILQANDATSPAAWAPLADVNGATTVCQGGLNSQQKFFLVLSRGTNNTTGPWGHYGQ